MLLMCLSYPFEHLRCILECCHMLYSGPGIIIVYAFSCPSDVNFFLLFFSGITWGRGTGVSTFIFQMSFVVIFTIFGVTVKSWLIYIFGVCVSNIVLAYMCC